MEGDCSAIYDSIWILQLGMDCDVYSDREDEEGEGMELLVTSE